jgi:hypothetical protein
MSPISLRLPERKKEIILQGMIEILSSAHQSYSACVKSPKPK